MFVCSVCVSVHAAIPHSIVRVVATRRQYTIMYYIHILPILVCEK